MFCLEKVAIDEIEKEMQNLTSKNVSQNGDIPTRIIKVGVSPSKKNPPKILLFPSMIAPQKR